MTVKIGDNVTIGDSVFNNSDLIEKRKHWNFKVGFTCGSFDLLHTGHALMLEEARGTCDYLVVGVQSDPSVNRPDKNKPVQDYHERILMVRAIKYVDEIVLYETEDDLLELLKQLKPDIRILGADWKGKEFTGSELSIEHYFNSRDHAYSTSSLRRRIFHAELNQHVLNEPYEMT
jgi:glycerol-3-phosphate cytidylyltransferase